VTRLRRRGLLIGLAGLSCAAGAWARPTLGLTELPPGQLPAEPLWAATLTDLDGRAAPLKPVPGRPLVVNFWARWCGPCRVEIPELVALRQREPGVDVVGINIEADPAPVRDFARAYEIDYPVRMAPDGLALMRALGNDKAGLPFTLVLDRQARIVVLRLGVLKREQLDAALQIAQR
jgi:thiol-disulfide isomerase/thioredoxin